jgi:hypothetical protein
LVNPNHFNRGSLMSRVRRIALATPVCSPGRTVALLAAGKVDAGDATALLADLDAAIACVESIPAAA